MRIRNLLLSAAIALIVTDARADDAWHGPGWYVMAYQLAVIIWSGPYDSRQACDAARPPDNDPEGFTFDCTYLDTEPSG